MQIAILGDAHFGARGDSTIFSKYFEKFYSEVFFPYLRENNITEIIQLGDIFDRRKYINFVSLTEAKKYFFDYIQQNNITLHILVGNHDIYYRNTLSVNSIELLLKEYSNIRIYKEPKTIFDNIDMIPWICEENQEQIMQFLNNSRSTFCMGHFEFAGFEMDKGNFCHEGLNHKDFSRYEKVISGHFHHKSQKNNILYAGTPYEMTWADYNDQKGFHILDTQDWDLKFIQNPFIIFSKLHYDDTDDGLDNIVFDDYKNKYTKVVVVKKTDQDKFERFIDSLIKAGTIDVAVVEDFTDVNEANVDEVNQADDTLTILSKYIDGVEIDLNKDKLKSIIKGIYTEALTLDHDQV